MVLSLDLVRGVTGGGFRGVRGGSCTKIVITWSIFELEALNFSW